MSVCSVDGCGRPLYGRSWCSRHYNMWLTKGDPLASRNDRKERICSNYKHPLWHTWRTMKRRCQDKTFPSFNNYGGRGISVCPRWLDFWHFVTDMGSKPSKQHQLDRIDGNGNYEPTNCRWASANENIANRRNTVLNEEMVRKIRTRREEGASYGMIARELGIQNYHVQNVCRGYCWTWVKVEGSPELENRLHKNKPYGNYQQKP